MVLATEKFYTKHNICSAAFQDIIPTDHAAKRCIDVIALRSAQKLLQVDLQRRVGRIGVCMDEK